MLIVGFFTNSLGHLKSLALPEVPAVAAELFQNFMDKPFNEKVMQFKKFKEEQRAYLEALKERERLYKEIKKQ